MLSLFVSITGASSALAAGPEWFEPEAPKAKPGADAARPSPKPDAARPSPKPRPAEDGAPRAPKAGANDGPPATQAAPSGEGARSAAQGAHADDGSPLSPSSSSPRAPSGPKAPLPAAAGDGARPAAPTAASPKLAPRSAPSAPAAAKARETTRTEWYGWQTLISDGASLALVVGGASSDTPALAMLGALSYVVMPPTIHALKGQHDRAGVSLGFRLLGPVIGVLGGMAASDAFCRSCGVDYSPTWVIGGALVGLASGPVVDAAFLSKREIKTRSSATLAPSFVPSRQGMTVGLAGAF